MSFNLVYITRRWLVFISIIGFILILSVVSNLLGIVTAIKGGYVLLGILLAGVGFYATVDASEHAKLPSASKRERRLGIVVLILCSLSIIYTAVMQSRLVVLIFTLPLGYLLLIYQMRSGNIPRWHLLQACALFFTATLSKFLDVGYYFGTGDIFGHIKEVERLIQAGSPSAISSPVYQQLPGLHILVGSVKLMTGLSIHDALLLIGILVYLGLVVILFVTVRAAGASEHLAVCTVIGTTVLERVLFYTTYFFPQSLATAFAIILIFITFRARVGDRTRMGVAAAIIGTALVFTHHLTLFLFAPLMLVVFLVHPLSRLTGLQKHLGDNLVTPRAFPILIVGLSALAYWAFYNIFIGQFAYAVNNLILGNTLLASSTTNTVSTYTIGTEISLQTPVTATLSLFTPTGLYYVAAVAILVLGILEVLSFNDEYKSLLALIGAGIASAPLVLKTPIAISQRIALPASFFFGVILGIGIQRLLRTHRGLLHQRSISVFIVVLLCATGPIAAANDVGTLNTGPSFYGKTTAPETQRALTVQELEELQSTSLFLDAHSTEATSFWFTSVVTNRFGADVHDTATVNSTSITTEDKALLYRRNWPRYQVNFRGARNQLVISEGRLNNIISFENKVYATGQVGLSWDRSKTFNSTNVFTPTQLREQPNALGVG